VGVDFFPCAYCNRSVCDCGHYTRCNDNCGRRWCNDICAKADGYVPVDYDKEDCDEDQDMNCAYCRNEEAENFDLLKFVLKKYNVTRDKILKEYLASKKDDEE
jgi:hypothetical protein